MLLNFAQLNKRFALKLPAIAGTVFLLSIVAFDDVTVAQESNDAPVARQARKETVEPVYRTPKATTAKADTPAVAEAPNSEASTVVNAVSNAEQLKPTNIKMANTRLAVSAAGIANSEIVRPLVDPVVGGKPSVSLSSHPVGSNVAEDEASGKALDLDPMVVSPKAPPHPLDQALVVANGCLANMRANVYDYSAIMVKRERIGDTVTEPEFMKLKVRCPRQTAQVNSPFSIYMKFLRPQATAGREVIWQNGKNKNNLCLHEGSGLISLKRFNLDPAGWIAMKGNRYPIYEAGLENLIVKLIEKAERDRGAGDCIVDYRDNGVIMKRPCDVIEVIHNDCRPPYDFHKALVFIDKELQLPVRYSAYGWPKTPGGEPPLLEEYTYIQVKLNLGLTDLDFDPDNADYQYPGR